jgi:hypothetical protein
MAPRPVQKKRRTRAHVIADLSANHVERHALLTGFSVERVASDYGIDLILFTYDNDGEVENGHIRVQLKATDRIRVVSGGQSVAVRISQRDLRHWLLEPIPIILVLYDAAAEIAYWLYVQAHFEARRGVDWEEAGSKVTVHLPRGNVVDMSAMRKFAEFRDKILAQTKGVVHHEGPRDLCDPPPSAHEPGVRADPGRRDARPL